MKTKIDPNKIPTRDEAVKDLICGKIKTGPHKDRKKEKSKKKCRKPVTDEE